MGSRESAENVLLFLNPRWWLRTYECIECLLAKNQPLHCRLVCRSKVLACVFVPTGSSSAPTLVPPVLRGLTELFLVVENLAQVSVRILLTVSFILFKIQFGRICVYNFWLILYLTFICLEKRGWDISIVVVSSPFSLL